MASLVLSGGVRAGKRVHPLLSKTLSIVTTLAGLLVLTFFMGRLLPADPVLAITGAEVDRATYERVYQQLGLDRPVWEQFLDYVWKVLQGDLGTSITTGRAVLTDLQSVFPATVELALVAIAVGTFVGVPLGVVAASNKGGAIDYAARIVGLAGHSFPIFWLGLMALLLFYANLQLLPASGRLDLLNDGLLEPITGFLLIDTLLYGEWDIFKDAFLHLILPASVLGYYSVAYISRMTRSFMLDQLGQEYITAARAKGMSRRIIIWRHAFKNIRVQLLTVLALTFGGLLEGAVLIETVFSWPGLGQYLTRGLTMNDMNVVMGSVLLIGIVFVAVNFVCDRLYHVFDPRTRK